MISEVAMSVNAAMSAALVVEHYMEVQKAFKSSETVHLWRKLDKEVPCKIARVWSPSAPIAKEKNRQDKREKKHRFVGSDAVMFFFTDCLWLGVKNPDREKKWQESKSTPESFPMYGDEFNYKFAFTTLSFHDLSTSTLPEPLALTDYTYHHSITLASPVYACTLSFDTAEEKNQTMSLLKQSIKNFQDFFKTRTNSIHPFVDAPINGKSGELLTPIASPNGNCAATVANPSFVSSVYMSIPSLKRPVSATMNPQPPLLPLANSSQCAGPHHQVAGNVPNLTNF